MLPSGHGGVLFRSAYNRDAVPKTNVRWKVRLRATLRLMLTHIAETIIRSPAASVITSLFSCPPCRWKGMTLRKFDGGTRETTPPLGELQIEYLTAGAGGMIAEACMTTTRGPGADGARARRAK